MEISGRPSAEVDGVVLRGRFPWALIVAEDGSWVVALDRVGRFVVVEPDATDSVAAVARDTADSWVFFELADTRFADIPRRFALVQLDNGMVRTLLRLPFFLES